MTPQHTSKADAAQDAWERKQIAEQLHDTATRHPGKVAVVSSSRLLDLREETTHIHKIRADSTRLKSGFAFRVKVMYAAIGTAANVRKHPEVDPDGPLTAGSIQPSNVHPHSRTTHVEHITEGRTLDERRENLNQYIQTHWDPRWNSRGRVTATDTRGDE